MARISSEDIIAALEGKASKQREARRAKIIATLEGHPDELHQAQNARLVETLTGKTPAGTDPLWLERVRLNDATERLRDASIQQAHQAGKKNIDYFKETRNAEEVRDDFLKKNRGRYTTEGQLIAAATAHMDHLAETFFKPRRRTTEARTGRRRHVTESAATSTLSNTTATTAYVRIIDVGQGSSGYYSDTTLKLAANEKAFAAGTQMHLNHDTPTETYERPEGSLRNLVGVLTEDAHYKNGALYAHARIGSAWRPLVEEFGEFIGVSISAAAEIANDGTVTRIIPGPLNRVDLVSKAGRGGRFETLVESARRGA